MDIVVLDSYTTTANDLSLDCFNALGNLTVYDRTPTSLIKERIKNAKIVLTNKTPLTKETLIGTQIQYIGLFSTGTNITDLNYCRNNGIIVTNVPNYSTDSVAQLTFAFILYYYNMVAQHNDMVKQGMWENCPDFSFYSNELKELCGKTIGIIGYGNIAKKVIAIAKAFSLNVLCYTRTKQVDSDIQFVSFDELLTNSDIISIHCPLTEQTKGLINAKAIAKMKKSALLINTARGPIVDEIALCEALNNNNIYAALDVVATEPILYDNPLLKAKNCILTPHIAWAAYETRERLIKIVFENLTSYLAGNPHNVVI